MMFDLTSLALLCATLHLAAADCAADNCIRAVTGTARQMSDMKYSDCQSYMQCTVTPVAAQVTVTVTATVKALPKGSRERLPANRAANYLQRRATPDAITNCPSLVPTYASLCSGSVRYSSACSCWGLTASTITASGAATITQTTTLIMMPPPTASDQPPLSAAPSTSLDQGSMPSSAQTTMETSVVSASSPQTYVATDGTTVVNIPTPTQFITLKVTGGPSDGQGLSYSTDGRIGVAGTGMDSTNGIFYIDGATHLRNTRDADGASFVANGMQEAAVSFTASGPENRLNCTVEKDYSLNCTNPIGYNTFRICQNYLYVTEDDQPVAGSTGGGAPCDGQASVGLKAMFLSG